MAEKYKYLVCHGQRAVLNLCRGAGEFGSPEDSDVALWVDLFSPCVLQLGVETIPPWAFLGGGQGEWRRFTLLPGQHHAHHYWHTWPSEPLEIMALLGMSDLEVLGLLDRVAPEPTSEPG